MSNIISLSLPSLLSCTIHLKHSLGSVFRCTLVSPYSTHPTKNPFTVHIVMQYSLMFVQGITLLHRESNFPQVHESLSHNCLRLLQLSYTFPWCDFVVVMIHNCSSCPKDLVCHTNSRLWSMQECASLSSQ
jgi:hypothetical protein